ncbi:hypothetical protein NO559_01610 [Dasania sp. GY-MA-18]|uniref:Uncharacterized protein n=1 Tax=Dasania phycosphaerae TaxID=2950436 RepID=A0A9J6RHE6_9GAMM|nr:MULTISPECIES: hypothetical protein [Dasania]MCR8921448.1 hypothetical protein [Dasania sp. GY-MA-18]MCZ0863876.1 hypothetical protein [Dasania phycosphaerae]MCZ0867604.1 hypothetical protein [Dasania phycosphaerae]
MSEVYVVTNQDGYFASKHKEWLDGREPKQLFRSPHKDEAINMVFELSAKDIKVRASTLLVELNEKGLPIVEVTVPLVAEPSPQAELLTEDQDGETTAAAEQDQPAANEEPKELTASERLSLMAARLRKAEG